MLSYRPLMNRIGTRSGTILGPSFGIALVLGVCVPGLAQSNTQKKPSLGKLNTSTPAANLASPSTSAGKSSEGKSVAGLPGLQADAQGPISAALGKDDSGYWVHPNADGFRGENLRQALVAEFTRRGAEVRSHNWRWGLEARGYGYGDALHKVKAVAPQANANRVEYRRDGVTEWYENGPMGLEQGFTLAHPPGKATGQPLTLELALRGDLVAAVESGGTSLELSSKDGKAALHYAGLKARDATARELRSWLEIRGERLFLHVEDGEARYPVVVDPWIQQAELTATDGAAADDFGTSIAVSVNTVVVGAPQRTVGSNSTQGAAYVFVQSGGTWSEQAELTASDGAAFDEFGSSVAVDGTTVVVGARGRNQSQGAAYVFTQSGTSWSQQAELTATDGEIYDYFGSSTVVSGSSIVVGAPGHTATASNTAQGAVYVFTQSGTNWSQQAELMASDGVGYDQFGFSVAVSGSTALVGAPCHPATGVCGPGGAYVFVESGGTWSQQAELAASDGVGQDQFGWSVALDATTAVVGATFHTVGSNQNYQGAAYVFVESGGTWSQQAELSASDGVTQDKFGYSVALLGSTAVVSAIWHPYTVSCSCPGPGAAYVFVESGGTWSQQAELTASDGADNDDFGHSVALDGSTVVGGAPEHAVGSNQFQGAAYVFGSSGPAYALSASPNSLNVAQGDQGTSTITVTPENGFNGSVSLSASGLPSGVTAAFNPNPATGSSTLTLTTSATAAADTATVRVIGTSGNLAQTTTLTLTVPPGPSYTLSASPNSLNMTQGSQGTSTITITPQDGFSGSVSLSASGLPSGITAAFNPNPATGSSTLTLTTSATASPYAGSVTVTGTSGGLTQTANLTLTVTQAFTFGPASGSPITQTISAGQTASFPLTLASSNLFSGTVNLSCAITPTVTTAPPTCTLPNPSVQISAGEMQSVVVNVATTAAVTTSAAAYFGLPPGAMPLAEILLLLCSGGLLLRNRKRLPAFAVAVVLALIFCVSCGGGSSYTTPPPHITPGTPSGTYTVTITATSGILSQNLALQVIVQ
jgi:nucleoside-specific outer membrane channel protein Tsx